MKDQFGRAVNFKSGPISHGRSHIRKHTHDKMRELTQGARKSKVSKRMDRPHRLDAATADYEKFDALMRRAGLSLN